MFELAIWHEVKPARTLAARQGWWNKTVAGWLFRASIFLIVCVSSAPAADQGFVLVGAGSSVPLPLYSKWSDIYNQNNSQVQLRYMAMGNGEGLVQISHGTSDFGAGEIPLTEEQRRDGNLIELPVVLIGIVPIYNLPAVPQLRLSGEVLAEVYLGHIKNWNDPAIVKLNAGAALPNLPIRVIFRPGGKGTNYVFTDFLSKTSARFREQIGRGPSPKWPVGEPAERSSDMADKVRSLPGSLGYVELQYASDNLQQASVLNASGKFVKATSQTIAAACATAEAPNWDRMALSLTNMSGPDSYPIVSFSWLYVRANSADQGRRNALVKLLQWAFSDGQKIAIKEGYSELPTPFLSKVRAKINTL